MEQSSPCTGTFSTHQAKWGGNGKSGGKPARRGTHPAQRRRLPCSGIPPSAADFGKVQYQRDFWRKGATRSLPCKTCPSLGPTPSPALPVLPLPAPHLGSRIFSDPPLPLTPSSLFMWPRSHQLLCHSPPRHRLLQILAERESGNRPSWERSRHRLSRLATAALLKL